ncbi:hypothetical protein OC846_004529 [Tilletia horrida]|uniref:Uncharacterized protein n=1 Tax=Tilletia horrida TaxID=155126 RepID=A0AAN6GSL1_9BASI|nr:hypothetical protein OC845_004700 [Tilletia horrida]KAK0548280.1 hypothetical protein OC846_004529 [Tilletia horrida]
MEQGRHSFARELFRFNNTNTTTNHAHQQQHDKRRSSAAAANLGRATSADGSSTSRYGVIQHRHPGRAPIPMRKAKTQQQQQNDSNNASSSSSSLETSTTSQRASRLSAILSSTLWNSSSKRAHRREEQRQQHSPSIHAQQPFSPPPGLLLPAAQAPSAASDDAVPTAIELPVGTRVGKLARVRLKQQLQTDRIPEKVSLQSTNRRRLSLPPSAFAIQASVSSNSTTSPRPQPAMASPQYPLPLPSGHKARTVLIGISPPPTASQDGSLATFDHLRKYVLRAGEEAILHTVLPESQARRKVTSPQDLIELTAELEREDEQFLEMQAACMNFLTLLAVELETSDRFVKIHVTQAQPPDGGSAAQARARSRSGSRSRSRPASSRGTPHENARGGLMARTGSLGRLLALGHGDAKDGDNDTERGRSKLCRRLKAREDEAIANELGRIAQEEDADLIVIGQPPPEVQAATSRSQSRAGSGYGSLSRPSLRTQGSDGSGGQGPQQVQSRRGSRATQGSSGPAASTSDGAAPFHIDRRSSTHNTGSALLRSDTRSGSSLSGEGAEGRIGGSAKRKSDEEEEGEGDGHPPPVPEGAMSGLSPDWNFGADSLSAVLTRAPSSAPPTQVRYRFPGNLSPRTPTTELPPGGAGQDELYSPLDDLDDGQQQHHPTHLGQILLVNTAQTRTSSGSVDAGGAGFLPPILANPIWTNEYQGGSNAAGGPSASGSPPPSAGAAFDAAFIPGQRRGSRVTIADEPEDSPLRQRDRDRAAQREEGEITDLAKPFGSSAVADGEQQQRTVEEGLAGPGSPLVSNLGNAAIEAPHSDTIRLTETRSSTSGSASFSNASRSSSTRSPESGSVAGATSSATTTRISKLLLGKTGLFSSSSSSSTSADPVPSMPQRAQQPLNGLADELLKRSPVPVLVVNEALLDAFR